MATRITTTLDNPTGAAVAEAAAAAGVSVSDWMARAARSRLLATAAADLAAHHAAHPTETAEAYAEAEAERADAERQHRGAA